MFPTARSPFSAALLRGLDIAVEFATLGEYRLSGDDSGLGTPSTATPEAGSGGGNAPIAPTATAEAGGGGGAPSATATPPPRATAIRPATPAARRAAALRDKERRCGARSSAAVSRGRRNGSRRARAGSVPVEPQECLVASGT
jgi:hypothetical protein